MEVIQHIELGSASANIDFTSIPQTFTDLYVLVSAREATTNNLTMQITFNGVSTNRSSRWLFGTGSSASSSSNSELISYIAAQVRTANTFGNGSIYIPNYASTTTAKSVSIDAVEEDNGTSAYQIINAGLWNSTAAINRITLAAVGGNLAAGSSATLYGIKNTVGSAKATGGTITFQNGYWVHTFTSSGTFTPTTALNAEVLIVAGGGGSNWPNNAGGGGAGGYLEGTLSLAATSYTVTVGAGGAGSSATNGSNSVFGSYTAFGGGFGGGGGSLNGANGGSGGGGGFDGSTTGTGGTATQTSQSPLTGYGGNGRVGPAGGGGGAGGAATGSADSAWGPGRAWSNGVTYAIGGSAGLASQTNAAANTGNGGPRGGAGGSGIVIVRYLP